MPSVESISLRCRTHGTLFFRGERTYLFAFDSRCFIFKNVHENRKTIVFDAIVPQLTCKTKTAVRYKTIEIWHGLKKHFRTIFG